MQPSGMETGWLTLLLDYKGATYNIPIQQIDRAGIRWYSSVHLLHHDSKRLVHVRGADIPAMDQLEPIRPRRYG